jgi:hypothetical protein
MITSFDSDNIWTEFYDIPDLQKGGIGNFGA